MEFPSFGNKPFSNKNFVSKLISIFLSSYRCFQVSTCFQVKIIFPSYVSKLTITVYLNFIRVLLKKTNSWYEPRPSCLIKIWSTKAWSPGCNWPLEAQFITYKKMFFKQDNILLRRRLKWIIFYSIKNFIDTIQMFQIAWTINSRFHRFWCYSKLKWIIVYAAWKTMLDFRILKPYENLVENLWTYLSTYQ